MSPWCADGDVPTAANLNLYGGSGSYVSWHCDDEPLFGGDGDPKLIVSLSLGSSVTFKWKAKSCLDSEVGSCRLSHGDLLVMDGKCQDEYLHCTSPGLADRRVNITYRWIRNHASGCPVAAGVLGSLPTCAHGSPVLGPAAWGVPIPELVFLGLLVDLVCGLLLVLSSLVVRKTGHRDHTALEVQFCPLGMNCALLGRWLRQGSWETKGWNRRVKYPGWFSWVGNWLPCKLAWWRSLNLFGYDACLVIKPSGAPWGRDGQKNYKTPNSPLALFLVSLHSLWRYWGCLAWHLWIGRARHPGPGPGIGCGGF